MRKLLLLLTLIVFAGSQLLWAQTKTITGNVTGKDDGMPIPGASIVVKGTTVGTVSDGSGKYQLSIPADANVLVISFIGMKNLEVAIANRTTINIALESESIGLEEVIAVAYGTAKKESFTGSADVVKSDVLQKRTVADITKAIEGVVAGVQTSSGGGQPGAGAKIRIRGFGSINASSDPLYVVDGVPYDGDLNAINPNDIESMTVLKDASASALYGARGANGVVIVTTKKGKSGEISINLKSSWGVSTRSVKNYNTVDQRDYMALAYESVVNQNIYSGNMTPEAAKAAALKDYMTKFGGEIYNPFNISSDKLIDPATGLVDPSAKLKYDDDWMDEATQSNPLRQEYLLSITGGTDKSRYLISLGYLDDQGLAKNTGFNRYSGRVSVDSDLKEWLKTGFSANFAKTEQTYLTNTGSSYNNIWYSAQNIAPIYPVYVRDLEGKLVMDAIGKPAYDYGATRPFASNFNSIATLMEDKRDYKADNLSGRTFFEFGTKRDDLGMLKDFKFTMNLGFDYNNANRLVYNNPFFGDAAAIKGRAFRYNYRTLSYTFNQLLNYTKKIDELHNFDILAGHEFYSYNTSYLAASRQSFAFGNIYELDAAATVTGASSNASDYKVESYLGRFNYNYNEKYYLSASYRTDGSSRFEKNKRWGKFWSVGASYRISQEAFMSNLDWLDNLTLKASYGSQGNDMLLNSDGTNNFYAWQSFYEFSPNNLNGGIWLSSLENKELKWEKNNNFNTGIEAKMLDSKLSLSVEYFHKETSDLLLFRPMATSTGFNGYWDNVGTMVNKGVDASIGYAIFNTSNFKWDMNIMVSKLTNEVTKLSETDQIVSGSRIIKVGEALNSFYLPKSAGVDPSNGKQLYWTKVKDAAGNTRSVVTDSYNAAAANKEIVGNRIPDFNGSIRSDFNVYGFDLSVLTTYSVGGEVLDGVYSGMMSARNIGQNWHSNIKRRWQKPGDITDVPRLELGATSQVTDAYLIDASYFAIKNVTLGYNLPGSVVKKIGVGSFRFFFTADNLALFNHLDGMDPQYNFTGGQDFSYVPIRTYLFGVDVKF